MNTTLINRLMDVVEATPQENEETFFRSAFNLLALALSRFPAGEREAWLGKIEDGNLRAAVRQFSDIPIPTREWLQ